jgi:hypothetical protein
MSQRATILDDEVAATTDARAGGQLFFNVSVLAR